MDAWLTHGDITPDPKPSKTVRVASLCANPALDMVHNLMTENLNKIQRLHQPAHWPVRTNALTRNVFVNGKGMKITCKYKPQVSENRTAIATLRTVTKYTETFK